MPITINGQGVINYTEVTDKYNSDFTGVYQHDDFAIAHPGDQLKQIKLSVNRTTLNTSGTTTIQVDVGTGSSTINLSTINTRTSFGVVQPPNGTSPTASSSGDTLTLTSADGSVTITGNSSTKTVDFAAGSTPKIAYITDQRTAGTNGGALTANAWNTRTLNTLTDPSSIVTSLSSNRFTLPAGTYDISGSFVNSSLVNWSQARIYNITDSTTALVGHKTFQPASGSSDNVSIGGIITIASPKVFELQNAIRTHTDTKDAGVGFDWGTVPIDSVVEVYAVLRIQKIS